MLKAGQVDGELALPGGLVDIGQSLGSRPAGIADDDVRRGRLRFEPLDRRGGRVAVGQIEGEAAIDFEPGQQALVAIGANHSRARRFEGRDQGAADAAAGPGNQSAAAVEPKRRRLGRHCRSLASPVVFSKI